MISSSIKKDGLAVSLKIPYIIFGFLGLVIRKREHILVNRIITLMSIFWMLGMFYRDFKIDSTRFDREWAFVEGFAMGVFEMIILMTMKKIMVQFLFLIIILAMKIIFLSFVQGHGTEHIGHIIPVGIVM